MGHAKSPCLNTGRFWETKAEMRCAMGQRSEAAGQGMDIGTFPFGADHATSVPESGLLTFQGTPPLPFIASNWRMSFVWFPPFITRIIFCSCAKIGGQRLMKGLGCLVPGRHRVISGTQWHDLCRTQDFARSTRSGMTSTFGASR